jgi:hypothetical protein
MEPSNKFLVTHSYERVMTPEEASARCDELKLSGKARKLIMGYFHYFDEVKNELSREKFEDSARGNGRLGLGQSWDSMFWELGEAMGVDIEIAQDANHPESAATEEKIREVYAQFFDE